MGKQIKKKIEEFDKSEMLIKDAFGRHSQKTKLELVNFTEKPLIADINLELLSFAVNKAEDFKISSKSSNRTKKVIMLAKFLFAKYKTPKILEQVWDINQKSNARALEYRKWFVCVGTGGSLHKEYLNTFLTKKESHFFINCPFTDISVDAAIVYSIAMAETSNAGLALRIAKSELATVNIRDEFWRNVVRFFAQKDKTPKSIVEINDLLDFLKAEKNNNPKFSIFGNGWTLASLKKRMVDWHYELSRAKEMGSYKWDGHAIPNFQYIKHEGKTNQEIWTIDQILTSKELLAEGKAQRHCVYSYRDGCRSSRISIWSMKMNGKRKVTIEVQNNGNIVQARRFSNILVKPEEDNLIREWANKNMLYPKYYR